MAEPFTPKPGYAFGAGPPPEVLGFLRNKGWAPAFSYMDVWGEEHAYAFTVAKAMEMDVLKAIKEALETALEQGLPYERFQRDLMPRLVELGWWGVKSMEDPMTGQADLVQLGSPRRLKTIYRANIRTARAAGQWERAQRTKDALPYFTYELGPSENHRPAHAAMAGTTLPIDDPTWNSWMPPNGWGCKCRVRQVGDVQVRREGLTVGPAPKISRGEWRNRRTGEITSVVQGIDPGWDTNPGKSRRQTLDRHLADAARGLPPDLREVAMRDAAVKGVVGDHESGE